jgi:glycolate oxidase iron-sulfur subunit
MLDFPARAAVLRAPLLEAFARSGAGQLLSANIGCRLHLANALDAPVRHPLDLLGELLADAPALHASGPTE